MTRQKVDDPDEHGRAARGDVGRIVPVVFGAGKPYFGRAAGRHLFDDPDVVIQGDRVLHLRYTVRRRHGR